MGLLHSSTHRVERPNPRVATPAKHQLSATLRSDHLVENQIRREADKSQVATPLSDNLVPGRKWDQVRKAFEHNSIAIPHEFSDGVRKRAQLRHVFVGCRTVSRNFTTRRSVYEHLFVKALEMVSRPTIASQALSEGRHQSRPAVSTKPPERWRLAGLSALSEGGHDG